MLALVPSIATELHAPDSHWPTYEELAGLSSSRHGHQSVGHESSDGWLRKLGHNGLLGLLGLDHNTDLALGSHRPGGLGEW